MRIIKSAVLDTPFLAEYTEPDERLTYASLLPDGATPSGYPRVRVRPQAVRQLFEFIQWGEMTEINRVEQAGLLYGFISTENPDTVPRPRRWSVVCGVIGGNTPKSTPTEVDIPAEEWAQMQHELETINAERRRNNKTEYQVVGWFHTHPNWLDPFFSNLDVRLQLNMAASDDRFGLVFNPHRRIWAAYVGQNSRPERGVLELDDALLERYSFEPRQAGSFSLSDRLPMHLVPHTKPFAGIRDFFELRNEMGGWDDMFDPMRIPTFSCDSHYNLRPERNASSQVNVNSFDQIWELCQCFDDDMDAEVFAAVASTDRGAVIRPEMMCRLKHDSKLSVKVSRNCWRVLCVRESEWLRVAQIFQAQDDKRLPVLLLTNCGCAIALPLLENDEARRP